MYGKYGNKLLCFSPPVMLATFLIEFGLACYVLWRYTLNTFSRLVVAVLFALGTFQLAEFMICGGLGLSHVEWARIGYVSITALPALGLHLVMEISGQKKPLLLTAAYATTVAYVVYFATAGNAIVGTTCTANYAVFAVQSVGSVVYSVFYFGWLLVSIGLAAHWSNTVPKKAAALKWMVIGYASFIVPTTLANILDPSTIGALPSILCGFAVLLAFILVDRVLPLAGSDYRRGIARSKKQLNV